MLAPRVLSIRSNRPNLSSCCILLPRVIVKWQYMNPQSIFIFFHTHLPKLRYYDGFYFRFLWDLFEQDRIKHLIEGLDKKSGADAIVGISYSEGQGRSKKGAIYRTDTSNDKRIEKSAKKIQELIQNFKDMSGSSNIWAGELGFDNNLHILKISKRVGINMKHDYLYFIVKYYVMEVFNLVNVASQYWFTDYFLGNQFWQVGYQSWFLEGDINVLPTMASCRVEM